MTTYTRDQLVDRILQKIMADGGAGQSADSEDQARVNSVIPALLEDLSGRGIVTVQDEDAIEASVFEYIAECGADMCKPDFSQERNPQRVLFAESRLFVLTSTRPSYEVLKSEYF